MKRVIIMHCWNGFPEFAWYPKAKQDLVSEGFEVHVPELPNTHEPVLKDWLDELSKAAGTPDENLFLIGHSVGGAAVLKYLETVPQGVQVGGVILVAGFIEDLSYPELENFFLSPFDFEQIRSKAHEFEFIYSDDDPYVPLKHGEILKEKLGGTLVIKDGYKHFCGPELYKESTTDLPDVVEAIRRISKQTNHTHEPHH